MQSVVNYIQVTLCLFLLICSVAMSDDRKHENSGQCVEGFTENLPINYTKSSPYKSAQGDTILFPSLRFKCTGYLNQVTILFHKTNCYHNNNNTHIPWQRLQRLALLNSAISIWSLSDSSTYVQTHTYSLFSRLQHPNELWPEPPTNAKPIQIPIKVTFSHVHISKGSILGLTIPEPESTLAVTSSGCQRRHDLQMIMVEDHTSVMLRSQRCLKIEDPFDSFPCFSVIARGKPLIKVDFQPVGSDNPYNDSTPTSDTTTTTSGSLADITAISRCQLGLALVSTILAIMIIITSASCLLVACIARRLRKGQIQIVNTKKRRKHLSKLPILQEHDSLQSPGMARSDMKQEAFRQMQSGQDCTTRQNVHQYQQSTYTGILMGLRSRNYETVCSSFDSEEYLTNDQNPECCVERDSAYWIPPDCATAIYNQMIARKYVQIPHSAIEVQEQLGEGEFGVVYKGQWNLSPGKSLKVAAKTLKPTASNDEKVKLFQEAAIMGQFTHTNIVSMYGVATDANMVTLVMELLENGDLHSHLLTLQESFDQRGASHDLLRFCQEIADGMNYLSRKGFIHRDLAARNILLTVDYKCKIADFGMSHELQENDNYKSKGGRIPLKWTAPEAILYRKYSTKSDVWSYGMVMYEIWSLGRKPFEDFSVDEVIAALSQGYYLEAPPDCPSGIYSIMMECWNPNAMGRPNFQEIVIALDEVNNKCKQAESTSEDIGTLRISTRANFTSRSASPAGRTGTSSTTTTGNIANTANITLNSKDM